MIDNLTDEEFEKYVLVEAQIRSQRRLYSERLIRAIDAKLQTLIHYEHPEMRSFGTWLLYPKPT
jgi:hypothetical protein